MSFQLIRVTHLYKYMYVIIDVAIATDSNLSLSGVEKWVVFRHGACPGVCGIQTTTSTPPHNTGIHVPTSPHNSQQPL